MQFSAAKSKKEYFFSQPHQPFFTLGIFNAIIFMILFIPAYKGHFSFDSKFFHAYSMVYMVFTNFFFGFLYTTFPRFSGTSPIESKKYLTVFFINLFASLSFIVTLFLPFAFFAASIFVLISFFMTLKIFYSIFNECKLPKKDQYWLIVALGIGAISNILFFIYAIPCGCDKSIIYQTALNFAIYMYLIFLGFVVAFRMVPFFSHVMSWKKNELLHILIFVLFLTHSFLSSTFPKFLFIPDTLAAILLIIELKNINLSKSKEPLLWILHLAIYWLPLALLLGSLSEFAREWFGIYLFQLPIHLLVLGFLTTVLIGFGTRVTIGHSGNILKVDKTTVYIFYFTQIVLLFRIIFSIAGYFGKITPFFDISATLWLILFLWWGGKYFKVLAFGERIKV